MQDNVWWMNHEYNRHRMARRPKGQLLVFGPRLGWRRKLRKRRYEVPEPDRELHLPPFGAHYCVGACMLADPWVQNAVATMAARLPAEEPDEPAKIKRNTRRTSNGSV